jgi:beta-galactosidase
VRCSHNPPAPEFLDACDRLGVLVIDETRMMTSSEQGLDDLETMIRRDRNHPSIILWSIGNEEPQQWTERGAHIATTMKRVARELDPTRGITAAMDGGYGQGITEVLDVIGFNYRDNKIDDFHTKFPKIPIIGTETASTVATRGEYANDAARHIVQAYDTEAPWWANTAEGWWPHFDAKPYIGGGFIWTGFDYRGEPTPYSTWPSISSQFGALDTCGFPKDNYYYYRAWWRPEPLLHLFPHWNWEGKEGQTISVWAYSNCDEVELFVNGKSAGKKTVAKDMHAEWSVAYAPGKIEAYGYKAGKVVLKDKRETAGPAAKIVLTADRSALTADGRDCAVIRAEVFDAKGRPVPKAMNMVTFAVTGPASVIGVGNGDPNCHEPDKASQRSAFNGLCCAILQAQKTPGTIAITASAEGLVSGKVILKSA